MSGRICPQTVQKQNLTSFDLSFNEQENEAPGRGSDSLIRLGTDVRQVQAPFMTKDLSIKADYGVIKIKKQSSTKIGMHTKLSVTNAS